MKPRNPRAGITQLEVILALAIMSMAGLALASFLGSAQGALLRSKDYSALVQQAQNRLDLRRWAKNMPLRFGDRVASAFVRGSSENLFLTTRQPGGDLQKLEISLDLQSGNLTVKTTQSKSETTYILAEEVQDLVISYYGRTKNTLDPMWHEAWSDPQYYPLLIKLEWADRHGVPAAPITLRPAHNDRQGDRSRENLLPPK
jgi:type II secretory pathway pseudopilin PulG